MSGGRIRLTMDGREILAEAGTPLLQVAIDAGIEIPHFCYHPAIGVEGSCRLCVVEIAGRDRLQTSCLVGAEEGMVVNTNSEPVRKARKGVLEFFLLNHPLDCPICDKGGECPLQNYSLDAGQSRSRMEFPKIEKEKHRTIGDHIVLDKERCVLCNRCVRFLRDFTGREELQIRNRGARSEIFIPDGTRLTTGFTGNLADMCPVGALTELDFRFRARPWELKTVDTICGECSVGCNVQVWRKGNEVLRMTPRVEPAVNEWWLCDRGRFSARARLAGGRLRRAQARPGEPQAPDAEAAAAELSRDLQSLRRGTLAVVADCRMTNEEFYLAKRLACRAGGRLFAPVEREVADLVRRLASFGLAAEFPEDLEDAAAAIVLGEKMDAEHPVPALRLRRLARANGTLLLTAGRGDLGFSDVEAGRVAVEEPEGIPGFLSKLGGALAGESVSPVHPKEAPFWNAVASANSLFLFLSDRWVGPKTGDAIAPWLERCRTARGRARISLLLAGANARGIVDQWDDSVSPLSELETEIQRGRVEGLLWFGPAPEREIFNEYARGMRFFTQVATSGEEAHPNAKWVLPAETFYEKEGTYTNTFGRIQRLRRSTRVVEEGFEPLSFLARVLALLGESPPADRALLYEEVAASVGRYPRGLAEIPESRKTYRHYERAL